MTVSGCFQGFALEEKPYGVNSYNCNTTARRKVSQGTLIASSFCANMRWKIFSRCPRINWESEGYVNGQEDVGSTAGRTARRVARSTEGTTIHTV